LVTSVGVFLVNRDGHILICRPTWQSGDFGSWSIPKGKQDGDEDLATTMRRELKEETNLDLDKYEGNLVLLGEEVYVHRKKKLVAFAYFLKQNIEEEPKCISFFTHKDGTQTPEMDKFEWVPFEEAVRRVHYTQANLLKRQEKIIIDGIF
jgi:8-oxo-dGTP pyrophosphatase MutT (NUDIX family)